MSTGSGRCRVCGATAMRWGKPMPTGRYCDLHWQERRRVFHRYPRPEASELRTRIAVFGNWAEVARSFGLPVRMGQTLRYELERWERQEQQTEKEHEPDYGPWL
jgi:hypothetical protein